MVERNETGEQQYINPNCWMARSINASPLRRCRYCTMEFRQCPVFRFLVISFLLIPLCFLLDFLLEGKVSMVVLLSSFMFVIAYGYFFNKTTETLVIINFELRKAKEILEETKASLEIKIKTKTKRLQELNRSLEEQVRERTKELQKRLKELEDFRKVAVGRELRIIELKKEVNNLKKALAEARSR